MITTTTSRFIKFQLYLTMTFFWYFSSYNNEYSSYTHDDHYVLIIKMLIYTFRFIGKYE